MQGSKRRNIHRLFSERPSQYEVDKIQFADLQNTRLYSVHTPLPSATNPDGKRGSYLVKLIN
jgi:hypothetical protein